jgi:cyclopropane fatty-acyl-phospholipid synthase-like methyltransferase
MGDPDMEHVDYDAELRLHNDALRRAYEIGPKDRVLDIGCGAGQTTRDAARLARNGRALGVDISKEMIERAYLLAEAEGLNNITFEHATRRTTGSRSSDSIWSSAGSARCSSATPSPHSPTSEGGYDVLGAC